MSLSVMSLPMDPPLTPRRGELLALGLKHRDELLSGTNGPVTEAQVDLVLRLRAKRQFESMLPPATDEFFLGMRTQLMQEAEFMEWKRRDKAISEIQAQRIDLIRAALERFLAEDVKARVDRKVDTLRDRADLMFAERKESLDWLRQKVIRKILRNRGKSLERARFLGLVGLERKLKNLLVDKYTDYSSDKFAPLDRMGKIPRQGTGAVDLCLSELNNKSTLDAISTSLGKPKRRPTAPPLTNPSLQKTLAEAYSLVKRQLGEKAASVA